MLNFTAARLHTGRIAECQLQTKIHSHSFLKARCRRRATVNWQSSKTRPSSRSWANTPSFASLIRSTCVTTSDEDAEYIRQNSLLEGEETPLAKEGHTIHYDGYNDQGRAPGATKNLVSKELVPLMGALLAKEREEGLAEVMEILKGMMKGKQAIVKLSCEGPTQSPFSIACAQITDSFYVAHSEDLLYRRGYEHFRRMGPGERFFRFVHSAGRLDENGNSVNLDKRRIYQDLDDFIVLSTNNQYAGNSVGLKKHAMRLAIKLSGTEGWLCEHMFVMSVQNEKKGRSTCFCGAFPSACGKTATAMLPGEKIIGDDIAYFSKHKRGVQGG